MSTRTARQTLFVSLIASAVLLLSSGLALAAQGDTIPHGGYDTSTDACLQCHDIHQAQGDYVLARWPTITALCGSCHSLYKQQPGNNGANLTAATDPVWAIRWDGDNAGLTEYGGPPLEDDLATLQTGSIDPLPATNVYLNYNPGYNGLEAPVPGWSLFDPSDELEYDLAQSAPFAAYQKPQADADGSDGKRGHRLGTSFTLGQTINHADGVTDSLDYIPGSSGRLTAIATPSVADSANEIGYGYMLATTSVSEFPVSLNGGLYCASCHTPHAQFSGQGYDNGENNSNMIDYEIIDKLLSKRPNHSAEEANLSTANDDQWLTDGGREYCGKCHDQRLSNTVGTTPHNHPDFACLQCHGNEVITMENNQEILDGGEMHLDFPHTSANPNLLTQEPDGLCINCHAPGALPLP